MTIKAKEGTNHWIPFTESELGLTSEFESHFMTNYILGKRGPKLVYGSTYNDSKAHNTPLLFSSEAQAVFDAGKDLWRYYHLQHNTNLNASYYDIREYFQGTKTDTKGRETMGTTSNDEKYIRLHRTLRIAHKKLSEKIAKKVYEHGFLR